MKRLFVVFLIGVSCFLFACGDNARKHYDRGNDYHNQGKLDEAIASYQKALAINPDLAEAHSNLGLPTMSKGSMM